MVEPNGGLALGRCASYRLEVLGEREGGNLMRLLVVSLSLFLFIGGCASLRDKCVYLKLEDNAWADITIGPYASTSLRGSAVWRSVPKDMDSDKCRDMLDMDGSVKERGS